MASTSIKFLKQAYIIRDMDTYISPVTTSLDSQAAKQAVPPNDPKNG
jgi:hypothetical protein